MSVFALRLPDDLKVEAAAQAEKAGLSLNQYIASALSARAGVDNPPREDDRLED